MKFIKQSIQDVMEITLNPIEDSRGFFMRTFDEKLFEEQIRKFDWVQENHSLSLQRGTLRGLHFQLPPFSETKLIRAIKGEVFDVFVDLRMGSPSFGEWGSIGLSDAKKNMALIPRGFAHGYLTLSDDAEVIYKVDNYYSPEHEEGIKWDDPEIGIGWTIIDPVVSVKDSNQPSFQEFRKIYTGLNP